MKKFIIVIVALFSFLGVQMLLADTTPNHFKFINQKNVALSTPIISNTITVSGIDAAADISIVGVGGTYSINGGGYTSSSGTVVNGNTVTLQLMSASSFSTTTIATLTIGGVKGAFSVKTLAKDTKPDKFIFTPQTGVELNTVITSNTIAVSGINAAAPISIVGGTYSINSGPYTITPGTVENGDTVTLQQTSAGSYNKKTTATLTIGGVKGAFSVTTLTFTKADLTGTWRLNLLKTGSGWWRAIATVDSSGKATLSSCLRSDGDPTCGGTAHLSINASGVVTLTGTGDTKNHFTMASNKKLIAGTSTSDSDYNIMIMQKDTGTTYSAGDVEGQSFVFHQLDIKWRYGTGTTDATGLITTITETTPSGTSTSAPSTILSVNSGVVTMSDDESFQGVLADDKKTIVGTFTHTDTSGSTYCLLIIQITGQTYTSDALVGTWYAHMLNTAPSWVHFTAAVASDGVTSFSHFVCSGSPCIGPSTTPTSSISSSGTITLAEDASFHGQMSDDGKFMVITQTMNGPSYGLSVYTR